MGTQNSIRGWDSGNFTLHALEFMATKSLDNSHNSHKNHKYSILFIILLLGGGVESGARKIMPDRNIKLTCINRLVFSLSIYI